MSLPACSIVVATYNRAAGLRRLLASLPRQDIGAGAFEVIVVDDGSTDGTWQMLTGLETPYRLRTLWQRNQGPGAARNAAIEAATGEIIVTLDDDVEPAPDLLRVHLEAHAAAAGPIAAIGAFALPAGAKLAPWGEWEFSGLQRQYEAMLRGDWAPTPRQFYTANASVPRAAYLAAGLFDPLFRRAEDVELAYRLRDHGVGFRFLPDAVIYHRPARSFASWQRMAWQYGFYDVLMWRQKNRRHVLRVIGHEFHHQRHPLLQQSARALVGRRRTLRTATWLAGRGANLMAAAGARRPAMPLYSAVFNLLYWEGVADSLGGRAAFLAGLEAWRRPEVQSSRLAGKRP